MMYGRGWKWKAASGYAVNPENGMVQEQEGTACTLHFYLAAKGDTLHLLDVGYEYAVATYGFEVDSRYIYTYDYQPEENWAEYRHDFFEDAYTQNDYAFLEGCYFRVVIRKKSGQPITYGTGEFHDLNRVLKWGQSESPESRCGRLGSESTGHIGLEGEPDKRIRDIVSKVCAKETKKSLHFLLMSDSHYTVNGTWPDTFYHLQRTARALRAEGIRLDGFLHLGDMTDGLVQAEVTRDYVEAVREDIRELGMPLYYVLGNHDSNYFRNNPERFSKPEIIKLYLPQEQKGYYYRDFPTQRLRMFFLESFDSLEKVRYGFSEEELDWLEEALLSLPGDWHVLVCSHVPPVPRLHYWSREIRGSGRLIRILRNFQASGAAGNNGRLLGFLHGHNHADQIDYEEGFPIISIGCNKCEYFEDKKPEGAVAYERKLGEPSQDLWDVMVVSAEQGALDFYRFGAGEDRHIASARPWTEEGPSSPTSERSRNQECPDKTGREKGMGTPMKKVITYGTFDLFHEGHYNILKRAKALGDYLIVGVTTEHYDEQRGKLNIVDPLLERIENVRHTGLVDEIIIEDHEGQKIEDVQKYGVDVFTLGSDWKGVFDYLKPYCQVVYLERTPDISSTMLRKGKYPIIRMGIVGTGRIAPRFIAEAKYVSGLNVQCAYNPHTESVEKFAAEYYLDSYSGDYEDFLDAVDAIYIASPHETHYDYGKRALLAGKHVLCEKPMAFTRAQAEELFALAGERHLVLMEGIKTAYCPGFAQMISIAKSGKIGEIRDVEACFSRLTAPYLREMVDVRYGGAFMEFGSYTILPVLKLLGLQYEDIKVNSIKAENGVDLYTKIYFSYPEGMATSKTGLGVKSEGQLLISGTKGYILAESPWWLTRKFQVRYEDPNRIETYTPNFLGDGLRYEIGEFASRINGRSGHAFKLTEDESIVMAGIVEQFLRERSRKSDDRRAEDA